MIFSAISSQPLAVSAFARARLTLAIARNGDSPMVTAAWYMPKANRFCHVPKRSGQALYTPRRDVKASNHVLLV